MSLIIPSSLRRRVTRQSIQNQLNSAIVLNEPIVHTAFVKRQRSVLLCGLSLFLSACFQTHGEIPTSQLHWKAPASERLAMDPEVQKFSDGLYHYLVGQLFFGQENYQNALSHFSEAGKLIDAPAPELRKRLAELRLKAGELDMALEESTKAVAAKGDDAAVLLLHAGILDSLGRSDEALPFYRQAIETEPGKVDAYILLAETHLRRKEFDQGIYWLKKLLEHAPDVASAHYFLGRAYELQGKLTLAEGELERAYAIDSDNHNFGIDLARLALKQDKPEEAKKICRAILARNPRHLLARRVLGFLLVGENKLDEALEHLDVLKEEESDSSETRFQIALIHLGNRKFEEAERELSLVLAANPEHSRARYFRATLYAGTGKRSEAVTELLKIKLGDGNFLKSRTLAAFILRQEKKLAQAESVIREGLKVEEGNREVLAYLIALLRDQQKFEEAAETILTALEHHPEDERFLFDYGIILYEQGKGDEAAAQMKRVLEVNPLNGDALNYLAYSYAEQGVRLDEAEEMVRTALRSRPQDGFFLDTLGWIFYKRAEFGSAAATFRQAVEVSGNDPVILEHLGETLLKLGQVKDAQEIFQRALETYESREEKQSPRMKQQIKRIQKRLSTLESVSS